MTSKIIEYLELAEKATPGPWAGCEIGSWGGKGYAVHVDADTDPLKWITETRDITAKGDDHLFIAASRTMGPALAKALIRAVGKLEQIYNDTSKDDNEMWSVAGGALADIEKILNGGGE